MIFYSLHVAIDNISEGHGALAKEAVRLYLENAREEGGDAAVQENWRRIRNGYITWATMGGLGLELIERFLVLERKQINISDDPNNRECWPDFKAYYRQQMLRLVQRKAPYGRQVHRGRSIGNKSLPALFDDPPALLDALVRFKYIDVDRPRDSKFMKLMDFNGPMYKVFTERDKSIVLDWIESLRMTNRPCIDPLPDTPSPTDLPEAVVQIIAEHAGEAMTAHGGITFTGPDGHTVQLAEMFQQPVEVMRGLLNNGWIIPGEENRSMFFTRIINNGGPMDRVLNDTEKETIRSWIAAGAQLPADRHERVAAAQPGLDATATSRSAQPRAAISRRQQIGMGAVH